MFSLLEFHGRLSRSDKRPANPGRYDLLFQLHASAEGGSGLWSETLKGVDVAPGGFYYVVLGQKTPLTASLFGSSPRWLSVRVITGGKRTDEHSSRVPIVGQTVFLGEVVQTVENRILQIEQTLLGTDPGRGARKDNGAPRFRDWVSDFQDRLDHLEGTLRAGPGSDQLNALLKRLDAIDGEEGRLTHLEDELDDIVGPDGDIIDLSERMEVLEDRAPELIANLRAREGETGRERIEKIEGTVAGWADRLSAVDQSLRSLDAAIVAMRETPPSPETIGAVKKTGDTINGALTITRGGLEIASGGLNCRGATVTTLEASNLIKTPKIISDAVELRGDLTVDSPRRVVQVRMIEGRHGSSRKDGALHLNSRGGAEVVVGNPETAAGLDVYGAVRSDDLRVTGHTLASVFEDGSSLQPGEVVCVEGPLRASRATAACDPRVLGVVDLKPGLLLGGPLGAGQIPVAIQGIAACKAEASSAPIRVGDLLTTSAVAGHAAAASSDTPSGAILGKALEGLDAGSGTIRVLLFGR